MQRYNPTVGAIKSWDYKKYGQYPVITDNLMNLEILLYAGTKFGKSQYVKIAESHLDRTAQDFIRVCFSPCAMRVCVPY